MRNMVHGLASDDSLPGIFVVRRPCGTPACWGSCYRDCDSPIFSRTISCPGCRSTRCAPSRSTNGVGGFGCTHLGSCTLHCRAALRKRSLPAQGDSQHPGGIPWCVCRSTTCALTARSWHKQGPRLVWESGRRTLTGMFFRRCSSSRSCCQP